MSIQTSTSVLLLLSSSYPQSEQHEAVLVVDDSKDSDNDHINASSSSIMKQDNDHDAPTKATTTNKTDSRLDYAMQQKPSLSSSSSSSSSSLPSISSYFRQSNESDLFFPVTQFTNHVQSILELYDFERHAARTSSNNHNNKNSESQYRDSQRRCDSEFSVTTPARTVVVVQPTSSTTTTIERGKNNTNTTISTNSSSSSTRNHRQLVPTPPTVSCNLDPGGRGSPTRVGQWWCTVLKQIFAPVKTQRQRRTLPYNVSFGIHVGDYLPDDDSDDNNNKKRYACLGSSARKGQFTMMNFLEVKRMVEDKAQEHDPIAVPWERRHTIPIWRGTPWIPQFHKILDSTTKQQQQQQQHNSTSSSTTDNTVVYDQVLSLSPRLKAIEWSRTHPSLLDARGHQPRHDLRENEVSILRNYTPSLYKLLTDDNHTQYIKEHDYYTQYQVALVLCGLGAAFRTSIHLSMSTAVVLQQCPYEEWFTHLMVPMKHYIPLGPKLEDLEERMHWIQNNPDQVRTIAEQGRQFYVDYLSFEQNEEHIYEFVYRLSLAQHQYDTSLPS